MFHFANFRNPHILDSIMQLLWTKTQSSPLEGDYFSCVPYLLGEGQAMQYSFRTKLETRTRVPRLPLRPPDNYLRDAMVATLAERDVEFDVLLQVQTDPFKMPIENNAVLWPTKLSPRVPAAVLRIPKQTFDSPEQLAFARKLTYNPWHTIAEHRPLGNQSRARKRMYYELSRLRQQMNAEEHYEPTGDETFSSAREVAQRREAGEEEVGAALDEDEPRHVRDALADAVGRDREARPVRRTGRRRRASSPNLGLFSQVWLTNSNCRAMLALRQMKWRPRSAESSAGQRLLDRQRRPVLAAAPHDPVAPVDLERPCASRVAGRASRAGSSGGCASRPGSGRRAGRRSW